ncbi:MAG TPA: heparan-alpha-glucosaminide N-acetyltransferase domain-containing protein [Acidimicrobiales bacterium]|nr:heparan-alpha-glucosaminide N-acetyltransferase domain-containing protein [Acidimicrobiales bacterium]
MTAAVAAPTVGAGPVRSRAAPATAARTGRLGSVDVVRGLAIAGMVLVNSPAPGTPAVFGALAHSEWNGWTFADTVFPAFVFVVGVSLALSSGKAVSTARLARRALGLFMLGLVVNAAPDLIGGTAPAAALSHLRVMGVLQRIALAYLVTVLVVRLPRRWQVLSAVGLLVGYGLFLTLTPVPGIGAGHLTPWGNPAGWLDRSVIGPTHMYHGGRFGYDPEGLAGTLPTAVTCLAGYWAGTALKRRRPIRTAAVMAAAGGLAVAAGGWLSAVVPVNKRLWTPSFVLLMAGVALLVTAAAHVACDTSNRAGRGLLAPLRVLGTNPLVVYVGSELTADVLSDLRLHSRVPAAEFLYQHHLAPLFGPLGGSAAYGALILVSWWLVAWGLHRAGWYLRL